MISRRGLCRLLCLAAFLMLDRQIAFANSLKEDARQQVAEEVRRFFASEDDSSTASMAIQNPNPQLFESAFLQPIALIPEGPREGEYLEWYRGSTTAMLSRYAPAQVLGETPDELKEFAASLSRSLGVSLGQIEANHIDDAKLAEVKRALCAHSLAIADSTWTTLFADRIVHIRRTAFSTPVKSAIAEIEQRASQLPSPDCREPERFEALKEECVGKIVESELKMSSGEAAREALGSYEYLVDNIFFCGPIYEAYLHRDSVAAERRIGEYLRERLRDEQTYVLIAPRRFFLSVYLPTFDIFLGQAPNVQLAESFNPDSPDFITLKLGSDR